MPPAVFSLFRVSAAVIGNVELVNSRAQASDFGRDSRFKPEAGLLNLDFLNDSPPEDFVTRFHIREVQTGGHVEQGGQNTVSHRMPVVQGTMFALDLISLI
jgi:hypothetical protein